MPFAPSLSKTKSAPVSNANVQRQTLRGFGDSAIDEAQETDVQTQLDHAMQFGHGISQPIQRQTETGLEEEEETLQRQAETGLEDEEEELPVQTKLTIGQPGDKYEQEADQMAAKVMRMPEPGRGVGGQGSRGALVQRVPEEEEEIQAKPLVQREAISEEDEELARGRLQRQAMPDEKEEEEVQMRSAVQREVVPEEETLQARLQAKGGTPAVPGGFEGQLASHRGGGQPLSDQTRAFMEPRFGADFSGVRVHETPDLANAIQAQAFTHGQDIYFNSGKYNPGSSGGKELLAHELTHVVQQTSQEMSVFPQKVDGARQSSTAPHSSAIQCQDSPKKISKPPSLWSLWLEDLFRIYLRSSNPLKKGPFQNAPRTYKDVYQSYSLNNAEIRAIINIKLGKVIRDESVDHTKRFSYYLDVLKNISTKNETAKDELSQEITYRLAKKGDIKTDKSGGIEWSPSSKKRPKEGDTLQGYPLKRDKNNNLCVYASKYIFRISPFGNKGKGKKGKGKKKVPRYWGLTYYGRPTKKTLAQARKEVAQRYRNEGKEYRAKAIEGYAIMKEGAVSAINTYDDKVLTLGTGFGHKSSGRLNKLLNLLKDTPAGNEISKLPYFNGCQFNGNEAIRLDVSTLVQLVEIIEDPKFVRSFAEAEIQEYLRGSALKGGKEKSANSLNARSEVIGVATYLAHGRPKFTKPIQDVRKATQMAPSDISAQVAVILKLHAQKIFDLPADRFKLHSPDAIQRRLPNKISAFSELMQSNEPSFKFDYSSASQVIPCIKPGKFWKGSLSEPKGNVYLFRFIEGKKYYYDFGKRI